MKHRFYYGGERKFSKEDIRNFSRGDYECKKLMRTRHGMPVVISHGKTYDIWKVEYGFSCVMFADYADAMKFCKKRFKEIPGGVV